MILPESMGNVGIILADIQCVLGRSKRP
jgi:hypothetical protein